MRQRVDGERPTVGSLCRMNRDVDAQMALSMAREHPDDVRPELIEWLISHEDLHRGIALDYAARYIVAFAAASRMETNHEAFALATIDALHIARRQQRRPAKGKRRTQHEPPNVERLPTAKERAGMCGISDSDFRDLRRAGVNYLLNGIREGIKRFLAVAEGRLLLTSTDRHSENITPAQRPTAVELSIRRAEEVLEQLDARLAELPRTVESSQERQGIVSTAMAVAFQMLELGVVPQPRSLAEEKASKALWERLEDQRLAQHPNSSRDPYPL